MEARLVYRLKDVTPEGHIIEVVIWHVPEPVPPCEHPYKYRLVYVVEGRRVIGYDNERGKGDHRHVEAQELPYRFRSVKQLIEDFIVAVEAWRDSK